MYVAQISRLTNFWGLINEVFRLNARKTIREDGDNIMELESYILNTGPRRAADIMKELRKRMDGVGNSGLYDLRAYVECPVHPTAR